MEKTESVYTKTTTDSSEKEGVLIKGKDIIVMDAPYITRQPALFKVVYDDATDTFTEYRKSTVNGIEKIIEQKYTLTVINKGTADEKVTEMTLPNGDKIEFVNW